MPPDVVEDVVLPSLGISGKYGGGIGERGNRQHQKFIVGIRRFEESLRDGFGGVECVSHASARRPASTSARLVGRPKASR